MPLHLFSITKIKFKKMKEEKLQNVEVKDEKKLALTQIKETPFSYATNSKQNYIVCGRVIMETEKNKEEAEQWINEKPWEAIGIMIQALIDELTKENNEK